MKLLHIDSSITGQASASRQLAAAITAEFVRDNPGLEVVRRDLEAAPIAHLDGALLPAALAGGADLQEFLDADIIVIGAPMYNFAIPSQLKAWIDRIVIAGQTFRYTETGPQGLAGGKKVVIASSRGGLYGPGTAQEALDFQEKYLRTIFGFIGVSDIAFVRAEGLAFGPEQREAAVRGALASVRPAMAEPALAA
ncbi:MAG TPA: FMN-dependent NADH-azoreductase [Caulobacteraceae bacterium]|jgi:FMN-dependent NADH-azoreductase